MATLKPDPAHDVVGNGTESHYDLSRQLEMRGYTVDGDSEDNEHSWVRFADEIVGEIRGDNPATVTTSFGTLYDYQTGDPLRPATQEERDASDAEVQDGRHEGVIAVDWRSEGGWNGEDFRRCYVER